MFLIGILSWWYGKGLVNQIMMVKTRLARSADFFSIGSLITTLFAPYHQISADSVSGPIGIQIQAFFDRLLSRFIGATVRSFMILFGLIAMFLQLIFGFIVMIFWIIIPFLPAIGLIAMIIGWVPQWTK